MHLIKVTERLFSLSGLTVELRRFPRLPSGMDFHRGERFTHNNFGMVTRSAGHGNTLSELGEHV